jgi:hypothetical protein
VTFSICVVLAATFAIIVFRAAEVAVGNVWGVQAAGILSAVVIIILGMLYKMLAIALTNWENHKTDIEHEDSLISKTFIFEFCNNYFGLFYVAFFKPLLGGAVGKLLKVPFQKSCFNDTTLQELNIQAKDWADDYADGWDSELNTEVPPKQPSQSQINDYISRQSQIKIVSIMYNSTGNYNSTDAGYYEFPQEDGYFGPFPYPHSVGLPTYPYTTTLELAQTFTGPGVGIALWQGVADEGQNDFDAACGTASSKFLFF